MRTHRFVCLLSYICLWLCTSTVSAKSPVYIQKYTQQRPIRIQHLRPQKPSYRPYTEGWSVWARSPQGWLVYTNFFIAKVHPFIGTRIGVQLSIISPQGHVAHKMVELKKQKLIVGNKSQLDLRMGSHRMTSDGQKGRVVISFKGLRCSLTFRRTLPGYRLFNGIVRVGKRSFKGLPFAPRAHIRGTITWKNKTRLFAGVGYLDRSWQNEPHKVARRWYNVRAYSKKYTVLMTSITPAHRSGPMHITALSIGYKGKWLFQSQGRSIQIAFKKQKRDRVSGYSIAHKVDVRSTSLGPQKIHLHIQHTQRIHRIDVLSHIPKFLRFFVQKWISKPFVYRYKAMLKMSFLHQGRQHTLRLPALTERIYLNP